MIGRFFYTFLQIASKSTTYGSFHMFDVEGARGFSGANSD